MHTSYQTVTPGAHIGRRPMTLADFSSAQLQRLYDRIYLSIGYGGCFGWDWPTLRSCYPGKAAALRAIRAEIASRPEIGEGED